MDAIGLASSIISFIEVAHKIVRGSYEVYKSSTGTTEEHDHTARVVGDLSRVAEHLKRHPGNTNDEQLLRLSEGCFELSGDLKRLLEKFLPKGPGPWQAFTAACRILRKQKDAVALEGRLDRYRQQISQRLILLLLYVLTVTRDEHTTILTIFYSRNGSSYDLHAASNNLRSKRNWTKFAAMDYNCRILMRE